MLQNEITSKENYDRFVERVRQSKMVWGLKTSDGWAYCPSNEHEGKDVIVFWSDKAYAARHVKENWQAYQPAFISLDCFVDKWLQGMHKDGVFVGPNWDAQLCGLEVEPSEIAQRLTEK